MAPKPNTISINNYIKPEPIFIEKLSQLPASVDKRRLYEVSEDAFTAFAITISSSPSFVPCSETEAESMRESLQDTDGKLKLDDFAFVGDIKCEKCARQLNYFDVFKTGEKIHGLEFLKWACLETPRKIGWAPLSKEQMLICTNCENVWKSKSETEIRDSGLTTDQDVGYSFYKGGEIAYGRVPSQT